jgi:hypothetical protein
VLKYILVFPPADEIIAKIYKGESKKSITDYCINTFNFSLDQATFLHHTILQNIQEIRSGSDINHHFQLYKIGLEMVLQIDGGFTGSWSLDQEHFMTGKVSMQILQKLYNKEEEDWMAVFHAAGISNGSEGILFPGDSGSGKSTLSKPSRLLK